MPGGLYGTVLRSFMSNDLTPMMRQYIDIKKKNPDCILFFRLGDFYEMFGEDAKIASRILQIALTSRGAGEGRAVKMPMCGVPFHAANTYIFKLISNGHKVAICEQLEDPASAKGIVKRDIVRIITPGTVLEEAALDRKTNNYIVSVFAGVKTAGLACADASTGEFIVSEIPCENGFDALIDAVEKAAPSEIILPDTVAEDKKMSKILERFRLLRSGAYLNFYASLNFQHEMASEKLRSHFKTVSLESLGLEEKHEAVSAAGSLIAYLLDTQKTPMYHINSIKLISPEGFMSIDAVSLRNLEITCTADGRQEGETLFSALDYTSTPMGAREMKKWLRRPLTSPEEIRGRYQMVRRFRDDTAISEKFSALLSEMADLERIAGKLGSGGVNARDMIALKKSSSLLPEIAALARNSGLDSLAAEFESHSAELMPVYRLIAGSIREEPPISVKDGGIIRPEYDVELKELVEISSGGKAWIASLQEKERERTGISSLKVGYTSVFGYYIEVSKANLKSVPDNYIRKQTLVNGERFITPELKEYESKVLGAQERIIKLEYEIFCRIRDQISCKIPSIQAASLSIASLDCLLSFAEAARRHDYVEPEITEDGRIIITEGRHPVVERNLGSNAFIPNDTLLDTDENMIMMITGPNMAGKSTYMRQVAVICVMAQAGSFVPAKAAKIGIVDRIFTRVGASDHLARGQSTFMVEMLEAANILNNATKKSLIILDEVGRGTSTFDGVSIAWAITEYIHDRIGARTLFATHYYELTEMEERHRGIKNYSVQVREYGDKIVFLRKIVKGSTDRSYGIHVAELAGLPQAAIIRANEILEELEAANYAKDGRPKIGAGRPSAQDSGQLDLFSANNTLRLELEKLDVENMTPVQALIKLKEIRDKYV